MNKKIAMLLLAAAMATGPVATANAAKDLDGTWYQNSYGWWYQLEDGTYMKSGFKVIDGKTYFFDQYGYMITGWEMIDGYWYYFDASGAMVKGWKVLNGNIISLTRKVEKCLRDLL